MTDDEALSLMLRGYSGHGDECRCQQCRDFRAGFHVALTHARRWRPLTSDEATWPTTGQWVLLYDGRVTDDDAGTEWNADSVAIALGEGWTHWLPLPPPSEEVGDG